MHIRMEIYEYIYIDISIYIMYIIVLDPHLSLSGRSEWLEERIKLRSQSTQLSKVLLIKMEAGTRAPRAPKWNGALFRPW